MDYDRSSLPDTNQQDLRARPAAVQERLAAPTGVQGPPVLPEHGGAVGNQRPENGPRRDEDEQAKERRRSAGAAVARFLDLPLGTELDIEVDVQEEQVSFLIRDRQTGELLRRIPEGEAQGLFEKLREFSGALLDRSL